MWQSYPKEHECRPSIERRRFFAPDLGGPDWRHATDVRIRSLPTLLGARAAEKLSRGLLDAQQALRASATTYASIPRLACTSEPSTQEVGAYSNHRCPLLLKLEVAPHSRVYASSRGGFSKVTFAAEREATEEPKGRPRSSGVFQSMLGPSLTMRRRL